MLYWYYVLAECSDFLFFVVFLYCSVMVAKQPVKIEDMRVILSI